MTISEVSFTEFHNRLVYLCCVINTRSPLPNLTEEKLRKIATGKLYKFPDNETTMQFIDGELQLINGNEQAHKMWKDNFYLLKEMEMYLKREMPSLRKASMSRLPVKD